MLANGTAGYYLAAGGGTAAPVWTIFSLPLVTTYASGSGTHTLTGSPRSIHVRLVGGGGGGSTSGTSGSTAAVAGTESSFVVHGQSATSLMRARGGAAAAYSGDGALGGTCTLGTGVTGTPMTGGAGGGTTFMLTTATSAAGAQGGVNLFAGGAQGAAAGDIGKAGQVNTGAGGSGGGTGNAASEYNGGGGGAGAVCDAYIINSSAAYAASYDYVIGGGGGGGAQGGTGLAGGAGGSGWLEITEVYQ